MFRFQSINQSLIKIKREVHYTIWALCLALIGIEIGYIMGVRMIRTPITITDFPQVQQTRIKSPKELNTKAKSIEIGSEIAPNQSKTYVASKTGTKYHLPTCIGARSIKEENKVWFTTRMDAEQAGYTPAGNCKGM